MQGVATPFGGIIFMGVVIVGGIALIGGAIVADAVKRYQVAHGIAA